MYVFGVYICLLMFCDCACVWFRFVVMVLLVCVCFVLFAVPLYLCRWLTFVFVCLFVCWFACVCCCVCMLFVWKCSFMFVFVV